MGGSKQTVIDTAPKQTQDMRNAVSKYILDPAKGGIDRMNVQPMAGPASVNVAGSQPISTTFNQGAQLDRSGVRDIQSVDQLGSATSGFFNNMMGQMQPAFQQARQENMAAAREGAGTMTGSRFANTLGAAMNRSLGNEQALAAQFAQQGMGMEMQRQGQNQQADMSFMNNLLTQNAQGLQAQGMRSQAEQFNSGQQAQQNQLQAQLDAQRQNLGFSTNAQGQMQNANNFANLLGQQASIGAGPTTVQQKNGFGSTLGSIGGMALGSFLGPLGTAAGKKVGGYIGGKF